MPRYHLHSQDNSCRFTRRFDRSVMQLPRQRSSCRIILIPIVTAFYFSFGDWYASSIPAPDKRRTRGGGGYCRANRHRPYQSRLRYSLIYRRKRSCTSWKWAFGNVVGS